MTSKTIGHFPVGYRRPYWMVWIMALKAFIIFCHFFVYFGMLPDGRSMGYHIYTAYYDEYRTEQNDRL
ncbi:MAG: hypothetical protein JRH08_02500 [Deltaproteobacteria bacterium]|nr:hypothetical protein [Deltaproteobacteria bacterium]MBW1928384.1 hypothetical protein [Deltaproteobacteria bacterium]MBW2023817.1 hypothetical protein [Deltaproteobacteria bacterium]MBW2124570.1 hypothetical protein [Deltaproteobacteria bacterium]